MEIIYNCKENKEGRVKMSMTIVSDTCNPFTVNWIKECKPKGINFIIIISASAFN
jgi:hypothetical protein